MSMDNVRRRNEAVNIFPWTDSHDADLKPLLTHLVLPYVENYNHAFGLDAPVVAERLSPREPVTEVQWPKYE